MIKNIATSRKMLLGKILYMTHFHRKFTEKSNSETFNTLQMLKKEQYILGNPILWLQHFLFWGKIDFFSCLCIVWWPRDLDPYLEVRCNLVFWVSSLFECSFKVCFISFLCSCLVRKCSVDFIELRYWMPSMAPLNVL